MNFKEFLIILEVFLFVVLFFCLFGFIIISSSISISKEIVGNHLCKNMTKVLNIIYTGGL